MQARSRLYVHTMGLAMRSIGAAVLLATTARAAPAHFEVKHLPGWDGPLLSKAYCGFSQAGVPPSGEGNSEYTCAFLSQRLLVFSAQRPPRSPPACAVFFNYIFLESENDPANDPVIVWCVPSNLICPSELGQA